MCLNLAVCQKAEQEDCLDLTSSILFIINTGRVKGCSPFWRRRQNMISCNMWWQISICFHSYMHMQWNVGCTCGHIMLVGGACKGVRQIVGRIWVVLSGLQEIVVRTFTFKWPFLVCSRLEYKMLYYCGKLFNFMVQIILLNV